jgi:hypothetical protein
MEIMGRGKVSKIKRKLVFSVNASLSPQKKKSYALEISTNRELSREKTRSKRAIRMRENVWKHLQRRRKLNFSRKHDEETAVIKGARFDKENLKRDGREPSVMSTLFLHQQHHQKWFHVFICEISSFRASSSSHTTPLVPHIPFHSSSLSFSVVGTKLSELQKN